MKTLCLMFRLCLRKLKLGKAAGHDGIRAEHLKYGGPMLRDWILQVCNAIVEVESIPSSLKTGIIIPVYKGCGKDPLDTNSYISRSHTNFRACQSAGDTHSNAAAVSFLGKENTISKSDSLLQRRILCRGNIFNHGGDIYILTVLRKGVYVLL